MEEIDAIIAADEEDGEIPDEEENESSWTIENGAAVKQADRHVFLYRESVVPPAVAEYFSAAALEPGQKTWIVLRHGDRRFDAFIEKTRHAAPRTRLVWKPDFAEVLAQEYPRWLEYFRRNRAESGDAPYLQFTRLEVPGNYTVDLEGVRPEAAAGEVVVPLAPGDTIDNETLRAIFRCSLLGRMRRSTATGSLVLVSDHTQAGNEDSWIGKVFQFTGMGAIGEQGPESRQNRTLAGSRENGVRLYLFEVFEEGRYVYMGEAELPDNPYRSRQRDSNGTLRDVQVFPLRLTSHKNPPVARKVLSPAEVEAVRRSVRAAPTGEPVAALDRRSGTASLVGERTPAPARDRSRPAGIAVTVKKDAHGFCQLCGLPAPFTGHDGQPYLEAHHIVPLAEGGTDTPANVVALCPNCHRKMHVLNLPTDVARLRNRVSPGD